MGADQPAAPRVWVLLAYDRPTPESLALADDPWLNPGILLGVFATRTAALEQLVEEIGDEAHAERHWTQPGPNLWYWEWREPTPEPVPGASWFGLEAVRVRTTGGGPPEWLDP